ncbi:MAG: TonB-dependent receptor, partial [Acidobacteriota bacterium]
MRIHSWVLYVVSSLMLAAAHAAAAQSVTGVVSDSTGAALPAASVTLREVATGREHSVATDSSGRFRLAADSPGTFLLVVSRAGFSQAARTIVFDRDTRSLDLAVQLELGGLTTEVTVTAARAEREVRQVPLHVETLSKAGLEQVNPLSTGDALALAANVTHVGSGPFGVRPRLRGLDSTRLLVLVDGERLNTARQATDRTGAEVGLIAPDTVGRMEIVNGAGTLMYGSDALAGTINIITNEPSFSPAAQWLYGFNGYYSSNERGVRGTGTVGFTAPRVSVRVQAGGEDFGNYSAGSLVMEDTRPFFADGTLRRADTIDTNFGLGLGAFPDPFNAPYVRTDNEVRN